MNQECPKKKRMMQEGGWTTGTLRDEEEELFELVDNIADLTMEHIKNHLTFR